MNRLLVVAGAAKAGTTTMVDALDALDGFCAGDIKEPRYFHGRDDDVVGPLADRFRRSRLTTWADYEANFERATDIPIDGSTDYLNDPNSACRIKDAIDDVRVIIGLRHPVARAFSEHQHLVRNGAEDHDFLTALHLETQRRSEHWVPLFGHVERSRMADGVATFLEVFGHERVFVYRFEDMAAAPTAVADRLVKALDLRQAPDLSTTSNRSGRPRSVALNTVVRGDAAALRRARQAMVSVLPEGTGARIRGVVDRMNLDASARPSDEASSWVLERTHDDSVRLEELLDIDLSAYRRPLST